MTGLVVRSHLPLIRAEAPATNWQVLVLRLANFWCTSSFPAVRY
jgi:hypothetical protein